jgi:hypothetical protein
VPRGMLGPEASEPFSMQVGFLARRDGKHPYFIKPSFRACSAQRNKFRYGLFRELQSLQRLLQSGRRQSHTHSLRTRMGRDPFDRDRESKMNSARQLSRAASVSLALIIGQARGTSLHVCRVKKVVPTQGSTTLLL